MQTWSKREILCVASLALLVAAANYASAAEVTALPVGSPAPDFQLKDQNGKECSLSACKGKIVVLDFSSIECPFSRGVDPGFQELVNAYSPKGVVFLSIDSNKNTVSEQIKQYAADTKLDYSILKDVDNAYADAVGAGRTPEMFVLDKNQKLAYRGAFDDRKVPEKKGETNYVKNALDDLLAGKAVRTAQVDAWGCAIKRVK